MPQKHKPEKPSGLWSLTVGEQNQALSNLERAVKEKGGIPYEIFRRLLVDPDLAAEIARSVVGADIEEPLPIRTAREVMDGKFFGPDEWFEHFGLNVRDQNRGKIPKVPINKKTLLKPDPLRPDITIASNHFLFLWPDNLAPSAFDKGPATLVKILGRKNRERQHSNCCEALEVAEGVDHMFRASKLRAGWYLMPISPPELFITSVNGLALESIGPTFRRNLKLSEKKIHTFTIRSDDFSKMYDYLPLLAEIVKVIMLRTLRLHVGIGERTWIMGLESDNSKDNAFCNFPLINQSPNNGYGYRIRVDTNPHLHDTGLLPILSPCVGRYFPLD